MLIYDNKCQKKIFTDGRMTHNYSSEPHKILFNLKCKR